MRITAIVLNAITAIFFVCFLAYTFVARQHLEGLARDFVTEKTLQYSKPIVDIAEESLDAPLVKKFLTEEKSAAIRNEIKKYREDDAAYIADLTRQKELPRAPEKLDPLLKKAASIKESIRTFYDDTLAALITDLRIFSVSNLVAATIALVLACLSSDKIRPTLIAFSIMVFITVLYSSWLYVDDLTFFRILFRMHMGWGYPIFLCVFLAMIGWDCYQHSISAEESTECEKAK